MASAPYHETLNSVHARCGPGAKFHADRSAIQSRVCALKNDIAFERDHVWGKVRAHPAAHPRPLADVRGRFAKSRFAGDLGPAISDRWGRPPKLHWEPFPKGNSGGANVWFFKPMPVPEDLRNISPRAGSIGLGAVSLGFIVYTRLLLAFPCQDAFFQRTCDLHDRHTLYKLSRRSRTSRLLSSSYFNLNIGPMPRSAAVGFEHLPSKPPCICPQPRYRSLPIILSAAPSPSNSCFSDSTVTIAPHNGQSQQC